MRRKQDRTKYKTPMYVVEPNGEELLFYSKVRNQKDRRDELGNAHFASKKKFIETDFDYQFLDQQTIRYGNNELTIERARDVEEQSAKNRRPKIVWEIEAT